MNETEKQGSILALRVLRKIDADNPEDFSIGGAEEDIFVRKQRLLGACMWVDYIPSGMMCGSSVEWPEKSGIKVEEVISVAKDILYQYRAERLVNPAEAKEILDGLNSLLTEDADRV